MMDDSEIVLGPQSPYFGVYPKKACLTKLYPKRPDMGQYLTDHVLERHGPQGSSLSRFTGPSMRSVVRKTWISGQKELHGQERYGQERLVVTLDHWEVVGQRSGHPCTRVRVVGQVCKGQWLMVTAYPYNPATDPAGTDQDLDHQDPVCQKHTLVQEEHMRSAVMEACRGE